MIESRNHAGRICILVDNKTLKPLTAGSTVETFRGEKVELVGGAAPHKPSSEGFVYVKKPGASFTKQYYAGVIDASWVSLDEVTFKPKAGKR